MSTDPGPGAAGSWTLETRGSFVLGRCDACGYTSTARRARYSVESDMHAHELLCRSQAALGEPTGALHGVGQGVVQGADETGPPAR